MTRFPYGVGAMACALAVLSLAAAPVRADADPPPPGAYTIVLLPDTQGYSRVMPQIFTAQTEWIRDHVESHNIVCVLHLGDVTDNNNVEQWNNAKASLSILDGHVPYAVALGNHDYGPSGNGGNRDTMFNLPQYFGEGSPYPEQPTVGGFYEEGKYDNSFHLFSGGAADWIAFALEFGPRPEVLRWVDRVLDDYPDRTAILFTHAYMYYDETVYDWDLKGSSQSWNPHGYGVAQTPGGVTDGIEMWNQVVRSNNFAFTFNGHVLGDGTGLEVKIRDSGHPTYQILSNYQSGVSGSVNYGNGFLRLLEFLPDGRTLRVRSYSPYTDEFMLDDDQRFDLGLFGDPIAHSAREAIASEGPILQYSRLATTSPTATVVNLGSAGAPLDADYTGSGQTPADFPPESAPHLLASRGDAPSLTSWTLSLWARPDDPATASVLAQLGEAWNEDVLLGLSPEGEEVSPAGAWALIHRSSETTRTVLAAPVPAVAGRWSHLAASSDGRVLRFHVDGRLVGEAAASSGTEPAAPFGFGGGSLEIGGSAERAFVGAIGEVALFVRALDLTDITEHRLTMRSQVASALLTPPEPPQTTYVTKTSLPALTPTQEGPGTLGISSDGRGLSFRDGVLMAAVAELPEDGALPVTVEAPRKLSNDGIVALAGSRLGDGERAAARLAAAWFPSAGRWWNAHIDAGGNIAQSRGITADDLERPGPGRYRLTLDGESPREGLLLAIGGGNGNNVVQAAVLENESGWDLRVDDNADATQGGDRAETGEDGMLQVLYVPLNAHGLIAGRYDGYGQAMLQQAGDGAAIERIETGRYRLTVPGHDPEEAILLLTNAGTGEDGTPEDRCLAWSADGGAFEIRAWDLTDRAPADARFVWVCVPLAEPPVDPGRPRFEAQSVDLGPLYADEVASDTLSIGHTGDAGTTLSLVGLALEGDPEFRIGGDVPTLPRLYHAGESDRFDVVVDRRGSSAEGPLEAQVVCTLLDRGTTRSEVAEVHATAMLVDEGFIRRVTVHDFSGISGLADGFDPAHLVDGSGIVEQPKTWLLGSRGGHHDASGPLTTWVSAHDSDAPARVTFDLGAVERLGEMHVWNFNWFYDSKSYLSGIGMKEVVVETSVDGETWTPVEKPDASTTFTLARADDVSSFTATNRDDGLHSPVALNGAEARYVRITAAGPNWFGLTYYAGLSEVRFYRAAGAAKARGDWMLYR